MKMTKVTEQQAVSKCCCRSPWSLDDRDKLFLEVSLASTQPVSSVFRLPSFSLGFSANQTANPQCMPILPVVISPPTAPSHQGTTRTPSASIQNGFRKPGCLLSPAELRNFKGVTGKLKDVPDTVLLLSEGSKTTEVCTAGVLILEGPVA